MRCNVQRSRPGERKVVGAHVVGNYLDRTSRVVVVNRYTHDSVAIRDRNVDIPRPVLDPIGAGHRVVYRAQLVIGNPCAPCLFRPTDGQNPSANAFTNQQPVLVGQTRASIQKDRVRNLKPLFRNPGRSDAPNKAWRLEYGSSGGPECAVRSKGKAGDRRGKGSAHPSKYI